MHHFCLPFLPLLNIKQLLELLHRILRVLDRVSDGSWVLVDLPIVAAFESLVAEEVNLVVFDSRQARYGGLSFDVLQAVRLVPTLGEDIERDLAANGITGHKGLVRGSKPGGVRGKERMRNVDVREPG